MVFKSVISRDFYRFSTTEVFVTEAHFAGRSVIRFDALRQISDQVRFGMAIVWFALVSTCLRTSLITHICRFVRDGVV